MLYVDDIEIPSDIDVIIARAIPQKSYVNSLMNLANLNKNVKLIGYLHNLHGNESMKSNMIKMLNRYDIILSPAEETFKNQYSKYLNKFIFFPNFFAPHERYIKFEFNKNPIFKCLLSGALASEYPLRSFIFDKIDRSKVSIIPHPGYKKSKKEILNDVSCYTGDKYANELYSYFCCLSTSSKFNYVLAKYLEIPAVGSLLIANETNDLKKIGFIAGEHYVSITKENALETIYECLDNPDKYIEIRKNGMGFVRRNHSINNRFEQLKNILNEI
jgi:glycosyltransferase involved in cell wall biosynthesis